MMKSRGAALGALLFLIACRSGSVDLAYRFDSSHRARYLWTTTAVTVTDSSAELKTEKQQFVAELDERIDRSASSGKRVLSLRATPLKVTENGHKGAVPAPSQIRLELAADGTVTKVVEADLGAGKLAELELDTLASEARPPLAGKPVAIGDKWPAGLALEGPKSSIKLKGTGQLSGFALEDGKKLARIEAHRRGTIRSTQGSGLETRELVGTTRNRSRIKLDVDSGILFSSDYRSSSRFVVTQGEASAGTLTIHLHSTLKSI